MQTYSVVMGGIRLGHGQPSQGTFLSTPAVYINQSSLVSETNVLESAESS